jgi:glycosyltransferase involved in cell wall biosynthesis
MNVFRHLERDRFSFDFLVQSHDAGDFDDEIRGLGGRVIPCTGPHRLLRYGRKLSACLARYGPYHAVHSHVSFSGVIMRVAASRQIPIRITHCHTMGRGLQSKGGLHRRVFLALTNPWIDRYSTLGLAASAMCAEARFGAAWREDPRWQVHHCAIDLTPFEQPGNRAEIRAELGLGPDAFVVGHVGRFVEAKNHEMIVRLAEYMARHSPGVEFLLIGDGALAAEIRSQIGQLGLSNVVLAGSRGDVPRLLRRAVDVFVFPSRLEGLGLALIEAQAAGLPCVVSDRVPPEADLIPGQIRRLSLEEPIDVWASALLDKMERPVDLSAADCLNLIKQTPFNIDTGAEVLQRLYSPPEQREIRAQ